MFCDYSTIGRSANEWKLNQLELDGEIVKTLFVVNSKLSDTSWSPDGGEIAIAPYIGVAILDANTGNLLRKVSDNISDRDPSWSPDGSRIAFSSDRDGFSKIYIVNAHDGSNLKKLTDDPVSDSCPQFGRY